MKSRSAIACAALLSLAATGVPTYGAPTTTAATARAQSNSPTVFIPDDDSVAAELTYHWQNPRYSNDERRQIGSIVVFLVVAAGLTALRPVVRSRRRRTQLSHGGTQ